MLYCYRSYIIIWCGVFPVVVDIVAGYFVSSPSHNSAREVIDAPLPQQDYVASVPPPPGGATTARTPSMSSFSIFFIAH